MATSRPSKGMIKKLYEYALYLKLKTVDVHKPLLSCEMMKVNVKKSDITSKAYKNMSLCNICGTRNFFVSPILSFYQSNDAFNQISMARFFLIFTSI